MQERISNLLTAIRLEKKTELDRFKTLTSESSMIDRVREGVTLYPIEFRGESFDLYDNLLLEFNLNAEQGTSRFSSNGNVELFSSAQDESVNGTIVKLKNEQIVISLNSSFSPDWLKEGKLGLNALPDTTTSELYEETLEKVLKGELRIAKAYYEHASKQDYAVESFESEALNKSQRTAVSHILSANPFHIVHGPPGTGKTKTLTEAILQMAGAGKKILVASSSNAAIDHITQQLAQQNKHVLRLGNSFKISEQVLPYTLKHKLQNDPLTEVVKRLKKDAESTRKKAFRYVRNFDKEAYQERKALRKELNDIRKDIRKTELDIVYGCIRSAEIITGTFVALQHEKLRSSEFDAIFIDEAGQALEPGIWSVAHFSEKLILAGDPMQLPPTLLSKEAEKLGLNISLIEKGIELNVPTTLLDTQYRMNDKIMQFSNSYFYDGKLSSDSSVKDICLTDEPHAEIEFIDTAGCGYDEEQNDNGGMANTGEQELIEKRLKEFVNPDYKTIGIISPYRKQVESLKEKLADYSLRCETVDSFQGQENDIIIVSMVRSNTEGTIGFLSDYRRMNVAMTRARKKLILIGDSATIGNNSFYQKLLDYVEQNGSYRSAWEFMT